MKYILEVNGKDEEKLINHIATELEIFKTQKVLDMEYKFERDKEELKEIKEKERGFFKKIFRRKK